MESNSIVLHYLYQKDRKTGKIEEYKFSNEYNIDTINNVLEIRKNPLFVRYIYGDNISNLSIAIGSNGSGKTTLCLKIINLIDDSRALFKNHEAVFIFSKNGQLYGEKSESITISADSLLFNSAGRYEELNSDEFLPIYITFVFNYSSENALNDNVNYAMFKNLSTTHLLKTAITKRNPHIDVEIKSLYNDLKFNGVLNAFRENEFTQIAGLIENDGIFNDFNVKLPSCIKYKIATNDVLNSKNQGDEQYNELLEQIDNIYLKIEEDRSISPREKFKGLFYNRCALSIVVNSNISSVNGGSVGAGISTKVNEFIKGYFNHFGDIVTLKKIISDSAKSTFGEHIFYYYATVDDAIDKLLDGNEMSISISDEYSISVNYKKNKNLITSLNTAYFDENISFKPLSVELCHENSNSSISSGELTLLSFFARLMDLKFNNLPPNIFLMIDEADLTLHPQWQKKYLNNVLKFLNNILPIALAARYNRPKPKIQLLVTTHSPILLSDAASNSVVYLDRVGKTGDSTFAQNIHELFNKDFILKDGLIGDFAQSKINAIVKLIEENKSITFSELTTIILIIKNISEPFIRFKLMEMIEGRLISEEAKVAFKKSKDNMIDEQIKTLQGLKTKTA